MSLMPGPSLTESRCAPTTTTRSARPRGESAMTLTVSRISEVALTKILATVTAAVAVASASPMSKAVPTTGIVAAGPPRVPPSVSVRPGWPSLKMMTPTAPGGLGVGRLVREGAGAALDEGDRCRR